MPNTRQSERSGHRRRPRCRAMLIGSFAPTIRNKCQHICSENGDIYTLDRACGNTWSKPLPNVFPKFLITQCHPMYAEWTQHRRRIETTSKSGRRLRSLRCTLAEGDAAILCKENSGNKPQWEVRRLYRQLPFPPPLTYHVI